MLKETEDPTLFGKFYIQVNYSPNIKRDMAVGTETKARWTHYVIVQNENLKKQQNLNISLKLNKLGTPLP
jgi:hypothetical protein